MKISQVIERLQEIQADRGDLEVEAYNYGDIAHLPAAPTVLVAPCATPVVLMEP
ncbi:hypothetical protein [Streptomyces cyaneofuscatus]|uniref:hypothetical protein n=1 Tax=Streptomyces cyaneofuscatus TaxID=66883 RepID=UPI0036DAF2BB